MLKLPLLGSAGLVRMLSWLNRTSAASHIKHSHVEAANVGFSWYGLADQLVEFDTVSCTCLGIQVGCSGLSVWKVKLLIRKPNMLM